jgi:hypothetical protein
VIELRGLLVGPVQRFAPRPAPPVFRADAFVPKRDPGGASQPLHGLGEREVLHLHEEVEDVASLPASEAVEDLLGRIHGEGRGLLGMEGA